MRRFLKKAKESIQNNLRFLVGKQKISIEEREQIYQRIKVVRHINDCLADVIIEAIVEKVDAKVLLFNQLARINHAQVIFATNTSSLSVSEIQKNIHNPQRVVGMHFFNPPYLMKLVEVVKGEQNK